MPEHDAPRSERVAIYRRERAAQLAARDEAVRVVERWNIALAAGRGALWSPTIGCASARGRISGTSWGHGFVDRMLVCLLHAGFTTIRHEVIKASAKAIEVALSGRRGLKG